MCDYVYPSDKGSHLVRGKQCKKPTQWSILYQYKPERKPYVHACNKHVGDLLDQHSEVNHVYPERKQS